MKGDSRRGGGGGEGQAGASAAGAGQPHITSESLPICPGSVRAALGLCSDEGVCGGLVNSWRDSPFAAVPPRRSLCPRRLRRRLGPMCRRGWGGSPGCRQQPEHCSSPPSRTRCPRQLQRLPGSGRVTTETVEKRLDGFCSVVSGRGLQQGVMCLTCPQPVCSRGETGALHVLRGVCCGLQRGP